MKTRTQGSINGVLKDVNAAGREVPGMEDNVKIKSVYIEICDLIASIIVQNTIYLSANNFLLLFTLTLLVLTLCQLFSMLVCRECEVPLISM